MDTTVIQPLIAIDNPSDPEALKRRIADLTKERDAALAIAAAEREHHVVLLQQCDHLASEIYTLRRGQTSEWIPRLVSDESRRLAAALETVRNMERSWFWRLRLVYVRLGCLMSRRRPRASV